jgi:hypothetical protein
MTDAVEKLSDKQRAGNNRIQFLHSLNQCCAPASYLESVLLTRASKNLFRQHRSLADITARSSHVRFAPKSGHSSVRVGCPKSAKSRLPQQVVLTKRASCAATFTITKQLGPDVADVGKK